MEELVSSQALGNTQVYLYIDYLVLTCVLQMAGAWEQMKPLCNLLVTITSQEPLA